MVEEKKKRGRPKKIVTEKKEVTERSQPDVWDWEISGNQRRDDLCVQMIMGTIAKQGTIKYDHAKDIFNTATQLAYDFGWMEKPKEKKQTSSINVELPENWGTVTDATGNVTPVSPLANTPADIFRQIRGES